MIKAVIFDFDGVIVESSDIKTEAFRRLFEKEFPEQIEAIVDHHKRNMGISRFVKFRTVYERILRRELTAGQEAELGKRFSALVVDEVLKVSFVPGALNFLKSCKKQYVFFIVSGTPHEELSDIVRKRELSGYFQEVWGSPPEKAKMIQSILDRTGLKPFEAAFVGDAASDLEAAKETGVHFIARLSGQGQGFENCLNQIPDLTLLEPLLKNLSNGRETKK